LKLKETIVVAGSANMDIVLPVDRLPINGETITGGDVTFFAGGKGANQACAARKLEGVVSFVAQVGNDPFGSALLASLRQAGVGTDYVGTSQGASGCASIYVLPGGENSIVISPGANAKLDPAAALARLDAIEQAGFVLLQLEIPIETVHAILDYARARGLITILDPAPARLLSRELLHKVDILTPNQSEAGTLLDKPADLIRDFAGAEEAAGELLALGPSAVLMKLGALGCLVATAGVYTRVQGFQVEAVDTTAAGDAFNGALAVALAEGKSLTEAALFANAAGAISVTRHGAQASLPCREDVIHFLGRSLVTA
jgi:ribokinase